MKDEPDSTEVDRVVGKRELARIALLEAVGGPRQGVADLCESLDLDPAEFAQYWDGHSAIPDDIVRRIADHLERRIESVRSLVSTLRLYLDDTAEGS